MPDDGDWRPVVDLCAAVDGELPTLVPTIVERIRAASPHYAAVPRTEHVRHVADQFEGLLSGLAGRRPPTVEQTARARELGRERARQGVPVEEVIGAYHVGYRELWNALLTRAENGDEELRLRLVRLVDLVWTWVRMISAASADAHAEATRVLRDARTTLAHRFLEALRAGEAGSDDAVDLARALGFAADGAFQAACLPLAAGVDDRLEEVIRRLGRLGGVAVVVARPSSVVAVFQGVRADDVTAAVHAVRPGLPVGVGLVRTGPEGAASTVLDAERALSVAPLPVADGRTDPVTTFEREWLLATLLPHRARLAPLLAAEEGLGGTHAHLAAAVRAYAEHGFSVTAGGRAAHLHPNTMRYRLERWRVVTGWDLRTPDGLIASLVALRLFGTE